MLKKIIYLCFILFIFQSCMTNKKAITVIKEEQPEQVIKNLVQLPIEINDQIKEHGSVIIDDYVYFIYDSSLAKKAESVKVNGTFNVWGEDEQGEWDLVESSTDGIWFLKKSIFDVKVPGNSGQPEYKFVLDDSLWQSVFTEKSGYKFTDAFIVLFDGDSTDVVIQNEIKAKTSFTTIEDFKNEYENEDDLIKALTNFRNVTSGDIPENILFRSYHPYKSSRIKYKVEKLRHSEVLRLLEENSIKSIINLSGEEGRPKGYYKTLLDEGNVLYAETSYKTAYFRSDSDDFKSTLKSVTDFIITHDTPYNVHCRLGTDRTGVVIAVLSAFMGASVDEIVTDYQLSNNTRINEFRDSKLIKYSLQNMLKEADLQNIDLQIETESFLKSEVGLTEEQIIELKNRLSGNN